MWKSLFSRSKKEKEKITKSEKKDEKPIPEDKFASEI